MNNSKTEFVILFAVLISIILVLLVPFIHREGLNITDSIDKVMYINLATGLLALLNIVFFYKIKEAFKLRIEDVLIVSLTIIVFLLYDYKINPAPVNLMFTGGLLMFWIVIRFSLELFDIRKYPVVIAMVLVGAVESVMGLMQIFKIIPSNHFLYLLTGTFYNPGPYSGFIAMLLPLSISEVIDNKKFTSYRIFYSRLKYYFFYVASALMIFVLPAGMSRSAWISAGVSCIVLYFIQSDGWRKIKSCSLIKNISKCKRVITGILILLFLSVGVAGIYNLKKGSADGRLLMWKVTEKAIFDHPAGVGLGGFQSAFANSQSKFLSQYNISDTLRNAAGSPEYAFNEYLQIGIEEGVLGLLLFLVIIISVFIKTYKNKRYGIFCALLSLCIFSFSSYPLQLPEFWVFFLLLAAMGISGKKESSDINVKDKPSFKQRFLPRIFCFMILIAVILVSIYIIPKENKYLEAYRDYKECKYFYTSSDYDIVLKEYPPLYKYLSHKTDYLFEGAQAYSDLGNYNKAVEWLTRATLLSSDPMIHYMLGKNYQAIGEYKKAEKELKYGISIIPERIYPYFLLTKLYSDTAYYKPVLFKESCDSVLYKIPKVMSPAIKEMREKVKVMLKQ